MVEQPHVPGLVIDQELGHGAHSIVYRGLHRGVPCAVKLPKVKARWSRWIYREAVSLARVRHALLPTVLEVAEVDGLPYLVMELVEGKTLADKLALGTLDENVAIDTAKQLASVLAAVHDAGLVHRDVKPRNIVVERVSGALKLVDFGFATPMERLAGSEPAGTAAYAAPEQLEPPGEVDGRTDLYAVGRVLFEALSGQSLGARPDGPWGHQARSELIAAGVSPNLAELIGHLLRRSPRDRYPNARALGSDLERLGQGEAPLGPAAYARRKTAPTIVGRMRELERVFAACRNLRGEGSVVLVRAPRGGGKSLFLASVVAETQTWARTLQVTCERDDVPLSALRRIFEAYAEEHQRSGGRLEEIDCAVGNLASVFDVIAPEVVPSRRLASEGRPVGGAADSFVEAAAEILLRLALRVSPLIIAVDDGHWLDPASADALVRVGHRIGEAPIALIVATRSAQPGSAADRFDQVRARTTQIDLLRLSGDDTRKLVAHHLGGGEIDPAIASRTHAIADGTPLGVLEVLGAFLDTGVVRPRLGAWRFDVERGERVQLPDGALALLGRRLSELPAATRRVLEAAAIVGTRFEDEVVAAALELTLEDLSYAMASTRRAGVVEADSRGHRFIHESLRETLVDGIAANERRRLHQRVGEVFASRPNPSFEDLCSAALHFELGETAKDPSTVARIARTAAEAALARFDNETALRFFAQARLAADAARISLDAAFFQSVGEAHVRLGSLDESIAAFELAFERSSDAISRAKILGRLSWVYQVRAEPELAWELLGRAFEAIGHRMPVEDVSSAALTSARVARLRVSRLLRRTERTPQAEIDLLNALHYQNARLGTEYGKPARVIQSSLEGVELSERGGSAATRARARALHAFVLTVLSGGDVGADMIAKAKELAAQDGDAVAVAFCVQLQFLVACWKGELDDALVLLRECVDVHGPWLELDEYVQDVATGDIVESMRGRATDSWSWLTRAIERLRRTRGKPVVGQYLIHRTRAALAALGRRVNNDPWLSERLASVSPQDAGHGFHRLMSWGTRARYYLEANDLSADFEALVRDFEREGHNPRSVHIGVIEYYVAVAHARLHQALVAPPAKRTHSVLQLRRAATDLNASAKIPLFKAHALVIEGNLAWFDGNDRKAKKLLAEAELVANQQSCPWVLYSVARARAHMLRAAGKEQAARDQAAVALLFAREHGAVTRARWIREEFNLTERRDSTRPSVVSSLGSSSSRTNRHLAALLQVARASRRELRTEQQAGVVLDELMSSVRACRAAMWFQSEPAAPVTAVFRQRGNESVSIAADSPLGTLLHTVRQSGNAWPPLDSDEGESDYPFDPGRTIAVPLALYDRIVGALCIERASDDPPFSVDDGTLLVLLSHQVPVTLEMARLLFEREQLHSSLQQAKKMEAMGQLAGGLAHDFNNMLGAMKVALSAARELAQDSEITAELDIIAEATTRAAALTSQLLSFSRHQPMPVAVHDVNQLVSTIEPMLRRVVGSKVTISKALAHTVEPVEVDQGSFDQALVNLVINARDAMPKGGSLTIKTRNVVLADSAAQQLNLPPGTYAEVEIADTGEGMTAETLTRIFEPFFTTKPAGSGTGLGLAMVYAFARNCGGSIDVSSEVGQGTQFRLYLRTVPRARAIPTPRAQPAAQALHGLPTVIEERVPDTILVVDDDDLVRRSIAKTLERNGYRVLAVGGSGEALDVARQEGSRIALVIMDVLMPGLTGPELGRRLTDLNLTAKLLFVSGFSPESIPFEDAQVAAEMLLEKPFSKAMLLERVRQLMSN